MLSDQQARELLIVARHSLRSAVCGEPMPETETPDPDLNQIQGAFVTLKKGGELRGCIGHVEGHLPLIETVARMAQAAALEDPRFPPVTCEEEPELEIEISIMSPLKDVKDPAEIEVGRHGLVVCRGYRKGLLLPQVATEWGWDREEFLDHTCTKAGLPCDAWKDPDTEIQCFEAEVIGESEDVTGCVP